VDRFDADLPSGMGLMSYSELLLSFPAPGKLVWIGLRSSKDLPMTEVDEVMACLHSGLIGDRYAGKSGKRQVSLLQYEHLVVIGALTGRSVCPDLLRRNLVVSGINLLALKKIHFRIGDAVLEITGACHPCSKMEKVLGPGGFNAMRGHGGVTARIAQGGRIRLGDGVIPVGAWE